MMDFSRAEGELKRFIHYGSPIQLYEAKARSNVIDFNPKQVSCIATFLKYPQMEGHVVPIIAKAAASGYSVEPYALVYALAFCVRKGSILKKKFAYKMVRDLAELNPEYLLVFTYYLRAINKTEGSKGFGKGWRRTICKWCHSKSAVELAAIILGCPAIKTWNFTHVLRLCQFSADEFVGEGKAALLHYIFKDYESMFKKFGGDGDSKPVSEYIRNAIEIKQSTDASKTLQLISEHKFTINFVNCELLHSVDIWMELIRRMDVQEVIGCINRLSKLNVLQSRKLRRLIHDKLDSYIAEVPTNVHPVWVYMVKKQYRLAADLAHTFEFQHKQQKHAQSLSAEGANQNHADNAESNEKVTGDKANVTKTTAITKRVFQPAESVVEDLLSTVMKSLSSLEETKLKYLIGIDGRDSLRTKMCGYSRFVSVHEAATLISLCLIKTEPESDVKVITLRGTDLDVIPIPIDKTEETISSFQEKVYPVIPPPESDENKESSNKVEPAAILVGSKIIRWAKEQNDHYDVIILLSDASFIPGDLKIALQEYQTTTVNPNVKLVICTLNGLPKKHGQYLKKNMFLISGFDEKVCQLIEGFSRGAF